MSPIFLLEGPDAVGKTTLARAIQDYYPGTRYIHLTLRREMVAHQVGAIRRAARLAEDAPVVIDRHWVSEQVYAGVYRGGTRLRREAVAEHQLLDRLGAVTVFVHLADVSTMVEAHVRTHAERPEMYEPDDRIRQVAQCYWDWYFGGRGVPGVDMGYAGHIARSGGMHTRPGSLSYCHTDRVMGGRLFLPYLMANGLGRASQSPMRHLNGLERATVLRREFSELMTAGEVAP